MRPAQCAIGALCISPPLCSLRDSGVPLAAQGCTLQQAEPARSVTRAGQATLFARAGQARLLPVASQLSMLHEELTTMLPELTRPLRCYWLLRKALEMQHVAC